MFHALAQRRTLEGAGRDLGVGVATVHRRVAALEEALGVRLFVRGKLGHERTEAGELLFARSSEIADLIGAVTHEIGGRDTEESGTVRITTTQSAADFILLPQLPSFRSSHPRLILELDAMPEVVSLIDERPSISLRFRRPERGDYSIRKLGDKSCSLYASKALKASLDKAGHPPDFHSAPHIAWTRRYKGIALAAYSTTHFSSPPAAVLGSMNAHLDAARTGVGIAHLPRFVGDGIVGLLDLLPKSQTITLRGWLVIPRTLRHMTRVDIAADFVAAAFEAAPD